MITNTSNNNYVPHNKGQSADSAKSVCSYLLSVGARIDFVTSASYLKLTSSKFKLLTLIMQLLYKYGLESKHCDIVLL